MGSDKIPRKFNKDDNQLSSEDKRIIFLIGGIIFLILIAAGFSIISALSPLMDSSRTTSSDGIVDTTTDTSAVDTSSGGQEDQAISTVKNYGTQYKAGWSIQDAIDSSLNLAETTGTLEVGGDWTATAIDNDNYYVTYSYQEATDGLYSDLVSKTIEFKVNINTGKVKAENYMAKTMLGIVKGE